MKKTFVYFVFLLMGVISFVVSCAKKDDGSPTAVAAPPPPPVTQIIPVQPNTVQPRSDGGYSGSLHQPRYHGSTRLERDYYDDDDDYYDRDSRRSKKKKKKSSKDDKVEGLSKKYARTGSDDIIKNLGSLFDKQTEAQADKSKQASESLTDLDFSLNAESKKAQLNFVVTVGDKEIEATLVGEYNLKTYFNLTAGEANDSTAPKIKAQARCLDRDATRCQVAVIKIMIGDGEEQLNLYSVYRRTTFKASDRYDYKRGRTEMLKDWQERFRLTTAGKKVSPGWKWYIMDSIEVLHGYSQARFIFVARDGEVVSVSGALKMQSNNTGIAAKDAELKKELNDLSLASLIQSSERRESLQNSIELAEFTGAQDGKTFTLDLFLDGKDEDRMSTIHLKIERNHPALRQSK